jgi:hypothetical protein
MARPGRFELPTRGLEVRCSVQLSYGRSFPNFSHYQRLRYRLLDFVRGILHGGRAGNGDRNTTGPVAGVVRCCSPGENVAQAAAKSESLLDGGL